MQLHVGPFFQGSARLSGSRLSSSSRSPRTEDEYSHEKGECKCLSGEAANPGPVALAGRARASPWPTSQPVEVRLSSNAAILGKSYLPFKDVHEPIDSRRTPMSPECGRRSGTSEMAFREGAARARLEVPLKPDGGCFGLKLHADHERPRPVPIRVTARALVVPDHALLQVAGDPNVVVRRIVVAANDVDSSLR